VRVNAMLCIPIVKNGVWRQVVRSRDFTRIQAGLERQNCPGWLCENGLQLWFALAGCGAQIFT